MPSVAKIDSFLLKPPKSLLSHIFHFSKLREYLFIPHKKKLKSIHSLKEAVLGLNSFFKPKISSTLYTHHILNLGHYCTL